MAINFNTVYPDVNEISQTEPDFQNLETLFKLLKQGVNQ